MNEKVNNISLCRCCLSSNCYKDLNNIYYCGPRTENYSNMLLDIFNLNISNSDITKNLICEECIKKIREGAAFKEQVLNSERILIQRVKISNNVINSEHTEITEDNILEVGTIKSEDINGIFKIDDETNIDLSAESNEYSWQEDITTGQSEDHLIMITKIEPKDEIEKPIWSNKQSKERKVRKKKINSLSKTLLKKAIIKMGVDVKPTKACVKRKSSEKSQKAQRENTLKLILNSNMCLFTSYKTKYGCYTCKERFLNIKELRDHTKMHSNKNLLVSRVNHLRGLSFKNVDISNLTCSLCSRNSQNLLDLQHHLSHTHDISFDSSEHFLIPYKLEQGLECVICGQTFNTFLRLSIHMNTHSTNNVCEICGISYINRSSLRLHVQSLHREKKCTLCTSVFVTNSSRTRHMRNVHNIGTYKRYCLLCEKTFRYTYMLIEHNIEAHGAARQKCLCTDCGKSFPTTQNLKIHIRGVHIKERNYPCCVCDMRFFTRFDQRRHERTHEDVRAFSCTFCETKFKTKDSWRRHLKRQHAHCVNSCDKTT